MITGAADLTCDQLLLAILAVHVLITGLSHRPLAVETFAAPHLRLISLCPRSHPSSTSHLLRRLQLERLRTDGAGGGNPALRGDGVEHEAVLAQELGRQTARLVAHVEPLRRQNWTHEGTEDGEAGAADFTTELSQVRHPKLGPSKMKDTLKLANCPIQHQSGTHLSHCSWSDRKCLSPVALHSSPGEGRTEWTRPTNTSMTADILARSETSHQVRTKRHKLDLCQLSADKLALTATHQHNHCVDEWLLKLVYQCCRQKHGR